MSKEKLDNIPKENQEKRVDQVAEKLRLAFRQMLGEELNLMAKGESPLFPGTKVMLMEQSALAALFSSAMLSVFTATCVAVQRAADKKRAVDIGKLYEALCLADDTQDGMLAALRGVIETEFMQTASKSNGLDINFIFEVLDLAGIKVPTDADLAKEIEEAGSDPTSHEVATPKQNPLDKPTLGN